MITYLLEYQRYMNIIGIAFVLVLAWLLSADRKKINYMLALKAFALQIIFAVLLIKIPFIEQKIFMPIAMGFTALCGFAREGAQFVFGNLCKVCPDTWGCVFACSILPFIVFFAVLTALLSHYGIIQAIVSGLNRVIRPLLGMSGPETLSVTSNLVLDQTSAPLLIKNYLANMSQSQLFVVMVSGMAHMSAALIAVYYAMGVPITHMIIAAVMGIPGAILIAKIMVPEQGPLASVDTTTSAAEPERKGNIFDAIFQGTTTGVSLAVIIGAMLFIFISLLPLLDVFIGWFGALINYGLYFTGLQIPALSLGYLFSWVFAPFAYLLGLSGPDLVQAAQLLGTKITINELVAFTKMTGAGMHLSDRAIVLLTYALGNFANLSSIGIQVGGISALAPSCQSTLAKLGLRAVIAGSLVGLLSAFIVGILI